MSSRTRESREGVQATQDQVPQLIFALIVAASLLSNPEIIELDRKTVVRFFCVSNVKKWRCVSKTVRSFEAAQWVEKSPAACFLYIALQPEQLVRSFA